MTLITGIMIPTYKPPVVLWGLVEVCRRPDAWIGVGLLIVCGTVLS